MAAVIPAEHTVAEAMLACGIAAPKDATFATEVFMDSFDTCRDMSEADLTDAFKTFSNLSVAEGRIRLLPAQKARVKAFLQWVKDQQRMGIDPSAMPFPVADTTTLIRRATTHKMYIDKSDTIASAAKPVKFTADVKWEDWSPSFINYVRAIPGRDGVPLKYVIRNNNNPDPTPQADFLDEYVNNAPLDGQSFTSDAAEVHTFIINFTVGNTEAESVIKIHENARNGRLDWQALKRHYEGQGIYAIDIQQAERDLETLYYAGEKKPTMWWLEFERRLNLAFNTYVKHEGRTVHSDQHKLRILLRKVTPDWLSSVKAMISVELTRDPVTYTYEQALLAFKTEVSKKYPPNHPTSNPRRIKELGKRKPEYGGGQNVKKTRQDSKIITLKNGKRIEYHPSFNFPPKVYNQFKKEQKDMLTKDRKEYKNKQSSERTIKELMQKVVDLESRVPEQIVEDGARTTVSQITQGTIMGGRNAQIQKKGKGQGRIGE